MIMINLSISYSRKSVIRVFILVGTWWNKDAICILTCQADFK